jgi:hypothetical protein
VRPVLAVVGVDLGEAGGIVVERAEERERRGEECLSVFFFSADPFLGPGHGPGPSDPSAANAEERGGERS